MKKKREEVGGARIVLFKSIVLPIKSDELRRTRIAKRKTAPLSYPAATTTETLVVAEEETIRAARRLVLNRRRLLSAAVTTIALRVPDRRHR